METPFESFGLLTLPKISCFLRNSYAYCSHMHSHWLFQHSFFGFLFGTIKVFVVVSWIPTLLRIPGVLVESCWLHNVHVFFLPKLVKPWLFFDQLAVCIRYNTNWQHRLLKIVAMRKTQAPFPWPFWSFRQFFEIPFETILIQYDLKILYKWKAN